MASCSSGGLIGGSDLVVGSDHGLLLSDLGSDSPVWSDLKVVLGWTLLAV